MQERYSLFSLLLVCDHDSDCVCEEDEIETQSSSAGHRAVEKENGYNAKSDIAIAIAQSSVTTSENNVDDVDIAAFCNDFLVEPSEIPPSSSMKETCFDSDSESADEKEDMVLQRR